MYYKIVIVGAGGTGSHFIARFSQFLASFDSSHARVDVAVVDGDMVEEGNIARQNFGTGDVMQNKAEAIAAAVADTYGLTFHTFPIYINDKHDLDEVFAAFPGVALHPSLNILVGACDNHRCRQAMERWFSSTRSAVYIDSANEFSVGEVVIGIKTNKRLISPSRKHYFPEIMRDRKKRRSEQSCGAVNKSTPQHIATNCEAGNIMLSILCQLLSDGKISGGIIYFDTFEYSKVFRKWEGAVDNEADKQKTACDDRDAV